MLDSYGIDTMLIGVYNKLSTNCQIIGYSQSITNQAAVCELVIIFRPTHNVTHCTNCWFQEISQTWCHESIIMMLDYYGIDTIPLCDHRACPILLSIVTNCQIIGYLQAITSQVAYYGIDTIPLHDDRASPILLSIVNKLSYSQIFAIHNNTSSCL